MLPEMAMQYDVVLKHQYPLVALGDSLSPHGDMLEYIGLIAAWHVRIKFLNEIPLEVGCEIFIEETKLDMVEGHLSLDVTYAILERPHRDYVDVVDVGVHTRGGFIFLWHACHLTWRLGRTEVRDAYS